MSAQQPSEALSIAQLLEVSLTQRGQTILDLAGESRVLLVFLRHAGCSFCREALSDVSQKRLEIEGTGTRIVLVHMGDTAAFEAQMARYGIGDLDHICDPDRKLYHAFGVRRGSPAQLFGPKMVWRALGEGVLIRHGIGSAVADPAQMPAVFLIAQSEIVRRFRHRSVADRPDYLAFCAPEAEPATP